MHRNMVLDLARSLNAGRDSIRVIHSVFSPEKELQVLLEGCAPTEITKSSRQQPELCRNLGYRVGCEQLWEYGEHSALDVRIRRTRMNHETYIC